jgi:hypothetical protein
MSLLQHLCWVSADFDISSRTTICLGKQVRSQWGFKNLIYSASQHLEARSGAFEPQCRCSNTLRMPVLMSQIQFSGKDFSSNDFFSAQKAKFRYGTGLV